jgi:Transposase DDE domain
MKQRVTREQQRSREGKRNATEVERQLEAAFTPAVVDELRERTGYNPRQRTGTALRLLLTVAEAFLLGQTLTFASLRAIFVRRFGFIRSCPFQKRFKQASAAAFFRAALEQVVGSVVAAAGLTLSGPLGAFSDVRVYDGTSQRVPPRGRAALPGCTAGKAGTKWLMGYSIKTGLLEHGLCGAETASETPLWRTLVPKFTRGVLYLFDLGFFERQLFADAQAAGAHVLMRLKSNAKVRVVGHALDDGSQKTLGWSLSYYLQCVSRRRGTVFDLDVIWGKGKDALALRLVGVAHTSSNIRWYLTTVPRELLTAAQVIQGYRLRWLVELLFREIKQAADLGRAFTADKNAVEALTYGAMLAHVLVRSLRIQAALANEIPLEQLRPLACLHVARAYAREIVDALASLSHEAWTRATRAVSAALLTLARELKPSPSRMRIALALGAVGA